MKREKKGTNARGVKTACPICQAAFNSGVQKFNANDETKFAIRSRASRLPLMDFCTPGLPNSSDSSQSWVARTKGMEGQRGNRARPHLLIQPVHRAKAIALI